MLSRFKSTSAMIPSSSSSVKSSSISLRIVWRKCNVGKENGKEDEEDGIEFIEITRNVSPLMNPCPSASNSL